MKYIGIDLGSSFIKAVLLDLEHHRTVNHKKYRAPRKAEHQNPYVFEIPAQELVQIVRTLIDEYTSKYSDVEGIIISTQMHGFVYSVPDREDQYISWQDMRCMDFAKGKTVSYLKLLEEILPPSVMEPNGVNIKPSLAICNLYALLCEEDVPQNGTLYTLGSYVVHALTGNNICHISNAAPMGIADAEHKCWNMDILRRLGLETIRLPHMALSDFEVCGEYESNGSRLKVHPDYGDMQVSILGSSVGSGDVVVNIATGAQVLGYSTRFKPGNYEIRPYFEDSYLYTISNMPAGRNLDVLVNFFCEAAQQLTGVPVDVQAVWEQVHHASLERDNELTVQTSFYKNPYFPDGGAIRGITQNNLHLGTLFQAAFADMADTYWRFIQVLEKELGDTKRIICAGGVSWKTPELRQMIEQVTGKPCQLSPMADEALSGMFHLSLICSGKCKNLEESSRYSLDLSED